MFVKEKGHVFSQGEIPLEKTINSFKYISPKAYNQMRNKISLDEQDSKFVLIKSQAFSELLESIVNTNTWTTLKKYLAHSIVW